VRLHRETLRNLDGGKLSDVAGGYTPITHCASICTTCSYCGTACRTCPC
jgi:hypothetical protein